MERMFIFGTGLAGVVKAAGMDSHESTGAMLLLLVAGILLAITFVEPTKLGGVE